MLGGAEGFPCSTGDDANSITARWKPELIRVQVGRFPEVIELGLGFEIELDGIAEACGDGSIGAIRCAEYGDFAVEFSFWLHGAGADVHGDVGYGGARLGVEPGQLHRGCNVARRSVRGKRFQGSLFGFQLRLWFTRAIAIARTYIYPFAIYRYLQLVAIFQGRLGGWHVAQNIVILLGGDGAEVTGQLVIARGSVFAAGAVGEVAYTVRW